VQERTADPPVAVGVRVDRLELGMNQRGLQQWSVDTASRVLDEIIPGVSTTWRTRSRALHSVHGVAAAQRSGGTAAILSANVADSRR
jgi:hypothetical protein